MKPDQFMGNKKGIAFGYRYSSYRKNTEYKNRYKLEIDRRIGVLNYRRERLEHELCSINAALEKLNKQLKTDTIERQLSL